MAAITTTTTTCLTLSHPHQNRRRPRQNLNHTLSFPPLTNFSSSGGGGGGGRFRYSRGGGGGDDDDERMGPWESFLEGLRLGLLTPERSSPSPFGRTKIIQTLVFCWVIERYTGWYSALFQPKENFKADMGANEDKKSWECVLLRQPPFIRLFLALLLSKLCYDL